MKRIFWFCFRNFADLSRGWSPGVFPGAIELTHSTSLLIHSEDIVDLSENARSSDLCINVLVVFWLFFFLKSKRLSWPLDV